MSTIYGGEFSNCFMVKTYGFFSCKDKHFFLQAESHAFIFF